MAAKKRTHVWEKCIAALLSEPTIEQAAARAEVGVRTLKNYLADPDFLKLYRSARLQIFEGSIVRLQQLSLQAVLCLHRNMNCGRPGVEVRAALGLLDQVFKGTEVFDLSTQVEDLRRQLAEVVAQHGNGRTQTAGRPLNGAAAPHGPGRAAP
jgi:hypothetical protein